MDKIVENIRTHNIQALLVIGGFEVRPWQGTGGQGAARLPLRFQKPHGQGGYRGPGAAGARGKWGVWLWEAFTFWTSSRLEPCWWGRGAGGGTKGEGWGGPRVRGGARGGGGAGRGAGLRVRWD